MTEEQKSVPGENWIFFSFNLFLAFVASWQVSHKVNLQKLPICSRGSEADGWEPLVQMVPVYPGWPRAPTLWFRSNHSVGKQPNPHKPRSWLTWCCSLSLLPSSSPPFNSPLSHLLLKLTPKVQSHHQLGFYRLKSTMCKGIQSRLVNKGHMTQL